MDLVSYVDKKTSAIKSMSVKATDTKHFSTQEITEFYKKMIYQCYELINSVKAEALGLHAPISIKKERLSAFKSINSSCAEITGNISHIHLDVLPPLRSNAAVREGEIYSLLYVAPIQEAIQGAQLPIYNDRIVLCFIMTVDSATHFVDHDNYFFKPIIDGIKVMLLPDDSSKHVSIYMHTMFGNKTCTDIYLVPKDDFSSFISSM